MTKVINPIQYASGYTLDLYCDTDNEAAHYYDAASCETFIGETFSGCAKEARAKGWVFHHKTRTATCPMCSKKKVGK